MSICTLDCLSLGESALIIDNISDSDVKRNLANLGVSSGFKIRCLYRSPLNDPTAYEVKNVVIAIRNEDAKNILIARDNYGAY